jgi:glyoxylase-like metal-dependent hydrolase (beta-lactamase superfamily II)
MKKRIFCTALLLGFLFSAHAQNSAYEVYAVKFAAMGHPTPIANWVNNGPKKDSVNIDFILWLVKGHGKIILIDAGFRQDVEEAVFFDVVQFIRPDSMLKTMGIQPGQVTDIILSHPHWDHIDGAGLFPNAQVWLQKEDYDYFVGSAWQPGENSGGYNKRNVTKMVELNLAGKLRLVNGDNQEIIPGIKVYTGSRHTYNSQYVQVTSGRNRIIIASDNIWIYYNLEHMLPPPDYGTLDPVGYVNAMARMKTLASELRFIIPGHDAQIFQRFPTVMAGVAQIK